MSRFNLFVVSFCLIAYLVGFSSAGTLRLTRSEFEVENSGSKPRSELTSEPSTDSSGSLEQPDLIRGQEPGIARNDTQEQESRNSEKFGRRGHGGWGHPGVYGGYNGGGYGGGGWNSGGYGPW